MAQKISIPHQWSPRWYQRPLFEKFDAGIKRFILVWHRRSGKDSTCFNLMVRAALIQKGNYLYLFPTARQGRKALWESIDKNGRRVIDQAVPPVLREGIRNDEMMIRLLNGSTIQVAGADNQDALVGTNYRGIVFSEYALTSPTSWRYMSPILTENGGWAVFNSTPRGKNHLYDLYETNKDNPEWWCDIKGARQTKVVTEQQILDEIRAGMPPEIAEQEFHCSFDATNIGAVYMHQLNAAKAEGRITLLPHDARYPVETWWDIGKRDATAIWFAQRIGPFVNLIEYHEERGKGLPHFMGVIRSKPYNYARHVGPHDLDRTNWVTDQKAVAMAQNFGIHFTVAPKLDVQQGIDAARAMFSRCRFDPIKCADGLAALEAYEREWDDEQYALSEQLGPKWASNGCDAFRYGAVTPEHVGVVPAWAKELLAAPPNPALGHNGGPPLEDPLDHWRGHPALTVPYRPLVPAS